MVLLPFKKTIGHLYLIASKSIKGIIHSAFLTNPEIGTEALNLKIKFMKPHTIGF